MKIGGNYILSRRNIARMIVALGTALMLLCSDTTAQAKDFVNRIHDTTDSLVSIDRQMVEATCTVVPEAKYRECKSVYLEAKRYNKEHENPTKTDATGRVPPVMGNVKKPRSGAAPATKADLRAAVKTIIRGEDVFASKPGPRITPAKQRQIDAAKKWRATHAGCSLHNACMRSFVPAKGGYKSAKAMFVVLNRKGNN